MSVASEAARRVGRKLRSLSSRGVLGSRSSVVKDEDAYYTQMFVNNPQWSAAQPNKDEQARWAEIERYLRIHAGYANQPLNILDVGCGRGWLSALMSQYGSVTGIEPVENVVEHAKTLFPDVQFFACTPNEYLEAHPNQQYDAVVSSEVIEHVMDKASFLGSLYALIKPGGCLIITTPRGELRKRWEASYGAPPQPVEEWVNTDELRALLSNSGFSVIDSATAYVESIYQIHLCIR